MPKKPARFIAQYDITYAGALLTGKEGDLFERRRFKRFITRRQMRAFQARFRSAWRGMPSYAENRGFKP